MVETLRNALDAAGSEWVLWLLFGLSVVSIAVIVERAWFLWARRVDVDALTQQLDTLLAEGRVEDARAALSKQRGMAARVSEAILQSFGDDSEALEDRYRAALERERLRYERSVGFLATLGANAPFIGLFGTVLGIIAAFADLEAAGAGQNRTQAVIGSISEALVATAVGLLVAIPAVVAYNQFQQQVERSVGTTEVLARTVMVRARRGRSV